MDEPAGCFSLQFKAMHQIQYQEQLSSCFQRNKSMQGMLCNYFYDYDYEYKFYKITTKL